MVENRRRIFWVSLMLLLAVWFWALGIELTYERNVRRGIPADFRIHRSHAVLNSRA
jgi:hypothetical protein